MITLCGCSTWHINNNQVTCKDFFDYTQCFIYDPIVKQQSIIDPNLGVETECSVKSHFCIVYLIEPTQCYTCQGTYTDAQGNTWKGKTWEEPITK
jgi:hypothetical protein